MIVGVMVKTGATVQARGVMYKAVEQSVLLYISESWEVTWEMLKVLKVFHHGAARCITGMTATNGTGGEWKYPLVVSVMYAAGLHPIVYYMRRR